MFVVVMYPLSYCACAYPFCAATLAFLPPKLSVGAGETLTVPPAFHLVYDLLFDLLPSAPPAAAALSLYTFLRTSVCACICVRGGGDAEAVSAARGVCGRVASSPPAPAAVKVFGDKGPSVSCLIGVCE